MIKKKALRKLLWIQSPATKKQNIFMLNKNNQIFSSWGGIFVAPGFNPGEENINHKNPIGMTS